MTPEITDTPAKDDSAIVRCIAMKIKEVRQITAHVVKTDDKDFPTHTRYGPNSWTVSMGESDEQVYECAELEAAFQEFIASNPEPSHTDNAMTPGPSEDIIKAVKESFGPKVLAAAACSPALAGLIERLALAAENYERVMKSLPHFWQRDAREECRHRAAGIREAISTARQCQASVRISDGANVE